ncbi:MAG: siphovirus Gp157 family protein [Oscillospiraceae bacterium]|nr:siphovirus Gp157 family protein [Oscillospiraceae bacterium]
MPLYEISEKYFEFLKACENGEIMKEAIPDTLEALDGEFDEKVDSIGCFIKNLNAEAEAIKKEITSLNERRTSKLKCSERLTEYLKSQMEFIGKTKIETARNKITIRKNPESVLLRRDFLNWARENADEFLKWKEPEPDKLKIREHLKNGGKLEHAELIQTKRLEIK